MRCDQILYKGTEVNSPFAPYTPHSFAAALSDLPVSIHQGVGIKKSLQAHGESHQRKPDFPKSYIHVRNEQHSPGEGKEGQCAWVGLAASLTTSVTASSAKQEEDEYTARNDQCQGRGIHTGHFHFLLSFRAAA